MVVWKILMDKEPLKLNKITADDILIFFFFIILQRK